MSSDIRVTPIDIQQKRFHLVFRGYERTEVEMFLDLVRDEMETLVREVRSCGSSASPTISACVN